MKNPIQKIYTEVPRTYEILNHTLTVGQDILWRMRAAKTVATEGGTLWLDMCSGTGEIAASLSRKARDGTTVVAADFSLPMMQKAINKPESKQITFTLAEVTHLPFRDNSFDAIVISFATRNINTSKTNLTKAFQEFHRILKPGGIFVNLETSQPRSSLIRRLFHLYVKLTVRPIGRLVSGSDIAYAYLSHTMRRFYGADELAEIVLEAGFSEVSFRRMFLGIAAIHKARK
ncbi:MAG: ubiquinone/menaquinone biosynthesis methyltransferase [Chloroflexi bacterium]|nr:ubiquinone/menaquinone biosynthesis methyltransferase [Chloroflexota bacterium]